jgi:hypothetical protein
VIVRFVDICGIFDHHCLYFFFTTPATPGHLFVSIQHVQLYKRNIMIRLE